MADITLADLQAKQQQMFALAEQIQREPDGNRVAEMIPEIQRVGAELQEMAFAFERQMKQKLGAASRTGFIEVQLTNEQSHRIRKLSGIWMDTHLIRDDSGMFLAGMPMQDPVQIEKSALEEAMRRKHDEEARIKAQAEITAQLDYLESLSPDHAAEVAKLRQSPEFLGWLKK